ncbi:MAG: FG-GAP repeat protein [Planctomycetota bacterium]
MRFFNGLLFPICAAITLPHIAPDQAIGQSVRNERLKILAADGARGDEFGFAVAISGTTAVVGAVNDDDNGFNAGVAFLFDVNTGTQIAKLLPSDGAELDEFGSSVGISGSTAIVGAYADDDNGSLSGSAYLFDATNGRQIVKLLPSDGVEGDLFGWSVGISGSTAIVGSLRDLVRGLGDAGSAYLFNADTGTQLARLVPKDSKWGAEFGCSVALSGSIAIVGARLDGTFREPNRGSAYLFDVTTASQIAKLRPRDVAEGDLFGSSVAISGSFAIVGASSDDDNGTDSGSAYLVDISDPAAPVEIAKLLPRDGAASDFFGSSVAISDSTAIVGASRSADNGLSSGSAYLFDVATGLQIVKLLPSDGAAGDRFGNAVAISGATAVVGALYDDDNGTDSGSTYLFDASGSPPPNLTLEFSGDCPGQGSFTVTNATAGGNVAIVHGFGVGPTHIPDTFPCAGTLLNMDKPQLSWSIISADGEGVAVLDTDLPPIACGQLQVQALDMTTCEISNLIRQ